MSIENLIMGKTLDQIAEGIYDASRRQAIYSYNVANSSTPGFVPIRFQDELDNAKNRYGMEADTFSIEEEMAKIASNSLKHSALVKLFTVRQGILRRVATQGKGG